MQRTGDNGELQRAVCVAGWRRDAMTLIPIKNGARLALPDEPQLPQKGGCLTTNPVRMRVALTWSAILQRKLPKIYGRHPCLLLDSNFRRWRCESIQHRNVKQIACQSLLKIGGSHKKQESPRYQTLKSGESL